MQPGAPWPSGFGTKPRRFEATAGMGRGLWAAVMVVGAVLITGLAGLSAALSKQAMQAVTPVFMILFLGGRE